MNLPYIQSEVFRELVGIETLLKPRIIVAIHRYSKFLCLHLWRDVKGIRVENVYDFKIDCSTITTYDQITAEINKIWQAIPAECKREDILK